MKYNINLCILYVVILLLIIWVCRNNTSENFGEDNLELYDVNSVMGKHNGFYSVFFFTLNHCIYSKIHNTNFKIISSNWLFKSNIGWEDYFEPYENNSDTKRSEVKKGHGEILEDYPIQYYKDIIPSIYKYNKTTRDYISRVKRNLNLPDMYGSIFIRRGDKIISGESKYEQVDKYIELLLIKDPFIQCIYVQTDDYTVIEELNEYILMKNMDIEIKTLCDEMQRGTIVANTFKDFDKHMRNKNVESDYIEKNKEHITKSKSVDEMNPDEIYNHTITMIAGVDIVCKSNTCVSDYQSNVGRFIKLFHNKSENVFSVDNPDSDIDYNKKVCPAHSF